jgi:hypothetical protein
MVRVASTVERPPAGCSPRERLDELAERAQRIAAEHVARCDDAMFAADQGEEVVSPASTLYDGCDTCVIRETLHAIWPHLERALAGEALEC